MAVKEFRISIFPPDTSINDVINSNGTVLDSICTSCNTKEECSSTGDYTLDAEFVNGDDLSDNIYEDCILKVLEDYGYEIFRIVKYNPKLKRITVMAKQITIEEQKALWLDDVRPTDLNGQAALNHMLTNAIGTKEIILESDINVTSTAYYERIDLYKACFDCDQSFANRWGKNGLEVTRRANKIAFNTYRGLKKNLTVRERKNLTGFSGNANIDSYVTRGIGKGYNGILGNYIESPKKGSYSRIKTKVFKYDDVKVRTKDMSADEEGAIFDTLSDAQAELDKRVKEEFSTNHVDDISATYNIDFVQLESTEEYKEYSYLEKADVGDYVKVQIPSIGIDITVRVMKKKYDVLKQRTVDMQLSNLPIQASISAATILNNLKKEYKETGNSDINRYVTAMLEAGLQNSNVIIRNNEILIMDTKDINTAKNVWRWNGKALAHSSEGYYSNNWNIGITQDGVINASMILAGVLSAVTIKNADGSFRIDLSKSGGCDFYSNGNKALSIFSSAMRFYNFGKSTEELIGAIATTLRYKGSVLDPNKSFIELFHEPCSMMSLGYRDKTDGKIRSYLEFDTYSNGDNDCSITFFKDAKFQNSILDMNGYDLFLNKEKYPNLYICPSTNGWLWCNGGLVTTGGFECRGDKNCIQHTDEYGDIKFSSIEDIGAYLTWREYDAFKEECVYETKKSKYSQDEYYSCIVKIPKVIQATIDTEGQYDVDINVIKSFANARLWAINKEYFLVKSDKPCKFNFVLTGRRKGFEARSLEEQLIEAEKYKVDKEEKENKDMILKARIKKYFKHNKRDFKLWQQCGEEWIANDGICDEG